MIRTLGALAALTLTVALAGEASAQTWSHQGIAFPGRDGWCAVSTQQDDGQGGKTDALELRPCDKEFPYMSLGVVARGIEQLDLAGLTAQAADETAGPEGEKVTTSIFQKKDPGCTPISRSIARDPIEGLSAFDLTAKYACPALDDEPTVMRNFTAYAQQKNGDVWVVAFDHPFEDLTEQDKQMIRAAVTTIRSN